MATIHAVQTSENAASRYADPVVQGFYAAAIEALESAPDGASAATQITGVFQRHHTGFQQANAALHADVRRLTADDSGKAAMLTHAASFAVRMLSEQTRVVGQLHGHQTVESRLHELARQLEESAPHIAEQMRDILTDIQPVPVAPASTVMLAHTVDPRWTCGWFKRSDRHEGPLSPLPFAGWVLVADDHQSPSQCVQPAFLHSNSWFTKNELAERGMLLERID